MYGHQSWTVCSNQYVHFVSPSLNLSYTFLSIWNGLLKISTHWNTSYPLFFFFFLKSLGLFSLQHTGMIQRSVLGRNIERASMHGLSGWPTPRLTQWDAVSGSQILNSRNFVSLLARVAISPKKTNPVLIKLLKNYFYEPECLFTSLWWMICFPWHCFSIAR